MTSIDSRIVTMKFDNSAFEKGVGSTLGLLGKLKESLNFSKSKEGMDALASSAGRFNMGGLGTTVEGVSKSFIALGAVAVTAISNITNRAVDAGIQLAKSLTTDPIRDGYNEYVTNLQSIQTILANTEASGAKLDDVNAALQQLNHYSDKTIYNFSEMARNIGTFTAAGVDLDTSVNSIKGIANLAALSGSNSQQASTAMYQLSQAIAAGRVGLQDWNSVVNAGMGGATFQRALATTAVAMGKLDDGAVKLTGKMKNVTIGGQAFRQSISAVNGEPSWLTSKVLTNTLQQFTGDLNKAQLKAQGFNDAQIKSIQQTAETAQKAATRVKSITQLIDVAKETVGSGWAKTWQLVFGDFKESRTAFTAASNTVNHLINTMSNARNHILKDWHDLGGRTVLIKSIKNVFEALTKVIKPIKNAFQDIFPPVTGKTLFQLSKSLKSFTESLIIGKDTAQDLRHTFRGVFAVFDILGQIVKGVASVIGSLFGVVGEGSGGVLSFTATIGDLLVKFDEWLKKGNYIVNFFSSLSAALAVPIKLIQALAGFVVDLVSSFDSPSLDAFDGSLSAVSQRLSPFQTLVQRVGDAFAGLGGIVGRIAKVLEPVGEVIGKALSGVGAAFAKAFSGDNFDTTLDVINTSLLGGITYLLHKFIQNGLSVNFFGGKGGMFDSITESFGALTGTLQAMQANIQANTLLKIAGAVGIISASIVVLSLINSKDLTKAIGAITLVFGQLITSMKLLTVASKGAGVLKLPALAAALVALSTAILVLTGALAIMSKLDWGELAKGQIGLAALLTMVSIFANTLGGSAISMTAAGLAMIPLATGINILAGAVILLSTMSWGEMAKGMVGLAGALTIIALAVAGIGPEVILVGPGLVAMGFALGLIAGTMKIFATMSWEEIGKAMVGLAGTLAILAGGLALMSGALVGAAALLIITPALLALGGTMKILGSMSWGEIAKSLVALAGALIVLGAGLTSMVAALPGAAALLVVSPALLLLATVLVTLGSMSWGEIVKGLVTLAAAMAVLGISSLILAPTIPLMIGMGVALTLIGAGFALAGAGALAFATAFSLASSVGAVGVGVFVESVRTFLKVLPEVGVALAEMMVSFAVTISKHAPKIVKSFLHVLDLLLSGIIKMAPKMGPAITALINVGLGVIERYVPRYVRAGLNIIVGVLKGIRDNIPRIVKVAVDIVVALVRSIGKEAPRMADAAAKAIIDFVRGLSAAIRANSLALRMAGADLALAIVDGMTGGLLSWGIAKVKAAAGALADAIPGPIKKILGVASPSKVAYGITKEVPHGMINALDDGHRDVAKSAENLGTKAMDTLKSSLSKVSDAVSTDVNMQPVISPILDLTKLQKDATQISGLLATKPITANVSLSRAIDIATDQQTTPSTTTTPTTETKQYLFTQNNYSPKALSPIETYRGGRNLFALAQEALNNGV